VPRVSVGLPVYNGDKYLGAALDSILAQDFEDFELIVSDNASTDKTHSICEEYAARDKRIRYVRNPTNIGAAPNHNRLVQLARGTYFKWAAHDDLCKPHMLTRCVEVLERAPSSVALVYPQFEIIDDDGRVIEGGSDFRSLDVRHGRPHRRVTRVLSRLGMGTAMYGVVRTETLKKTRMMGGFDRSDYVLLVELSMLGELWEIPETLLSRRFHSGHSAAMHPTTKALAAWYDPSTNGTWNLPRREKLALEYLRSAYRLPMPRADKLLCMFSAPAVHYLLSVIQAARRVKHKVMRG
jgi:hypothetical protein